MTSSRRKALDAATRVVRVCDVLAEIAAGTGIEEFVNSTPTQWAVEMGLIRIGEAVNRIPPEILEQFADQPWREIVAMRNFAAHQYDDLEPRRVWRTLTKDVPTLRAYLDDVMMSALRR